MTITLLVCGGRTFDDYPLMARTLDDIIKRRGRPRRILHGGAPGADSLSSRYAYERKINLEIIGALWGTHGSAAGPIRNKVMLGRLYPDDCVVGFPVGESRGTHHMLNMARRATIELEVVEVAS